MNPVLVQTLRIVATPKSIARHCSAKRTMSALEEKAAWNDIQEARYKRAVRIVRRGLG